MAATVNKKFEPEVKAGKPTNWQWPASTEDKLASGWVYVAIPERNPVWTKSPHPTVTLNNMKFRPGQTYLVPPQLAATVKERMEVFAREQVRAVQPDLDRGALNDVNTGRNNGTKDFSFEAESFAVAR